MAGIGVFAAIWARGVEEGVAHDHAGVDADEGDGIFAVIDHAGGGEERVVNAGHHLRAIGTPQLVIERRRDVGVGEAGFEHGCGARFGHGAHSPVEAILLQR